MFSNDYKVSLTIVFLNDDIKFRSLLYGALQLNINSLKFIIYIYNYVPTGGEWPSDASAQHIALQRIVKTPLSLSTKFA